nr:MAG TPA: hypothetical protein [Caudoviricetes sp.]
MKFWMRYIKTSGRVQSYRLYLAIRKPQPKELIR